MENPLNTLVGKSVAIVGGSGLLGNSIAKACKAAGGKIIILDIKLPSELGGMQFHQFDVTDFSTPHDTLNIIETQCGNIDVWINSGYPCTNNWGSVESEKADQVKDWQRNIDMQLNSACIWATAMAERMQNRGGSILQIASIYGLVAADDNMYQGLNMGAGTPAAYSAIKGAIIAHAKALACRFAPKVRVNIICPGGILNNQPEGFLERYNQKTPLQRMARPEEIAAPAVFLSSGAASYITGSTLVVDGGFTCL